MAPFTPTAEMRAEAERGLQWRREHGRGGTEVGVARARDIANGRDLPIDTVRRMVSYFARHEVDKQATGWSSGEDGFPSAGRIAWALWGGDPGRAWANRIAAQNDEGRAAMPDDVIDIDEIRRAFARGDERERFWVRLEERQVDEVDGRPRLTGLASVFNERARVRLQDGRVVHEEVTRSAFNNTLNRGDIFLLWQHDWTQPLARTGAGNLQLRVTDDGLAYDATLPDTQAARDAAELVRTGVVSEMSFGFTIPSGGDRVTVEQDGTLLRSLLDVKLHEVSLVSRGAYGPKANAVLRSDAFGMLCRSLGLDEDQVLAATHDGDGAQCAAMMRSAIGAQPVEPGAGTTSEQAARAGTTAAAGTHSRALAELLQREAAWRARIPR